MDDKEIINLFNQRNENAIKETDKKYSTYLFSIAVNILNSREDSQECLNDTYLRAWNTIPPNCPPKLSFYLGRIIRGLSIDKWRMRHSEKRLVSEYAVSIEELGECFPSSEKAEAGAELSRLTDLLNSFLEDLEQEARSVFIRRYYFCDSIKSISQMTGFSESKVKSMLLRMRQALRAMLEKEGITV